MNTSKVPHEFQWTDEAIGNFWDYAANSVLMRLSFSRLCAPELERLISERIPRNKTICDFGAGSGDMIAALLKLGYKVGAYEPSEERRADFPEEIAASPSFLGFQTDRKYDCVICFEVLEHLTDANLVPTLRTIDDILAENGTLLGSCPWDEDLRDNYCLCPSCHSLFHRWQHMRSFNPTTMKELLLAHGFVPTEIFRANFVNSLVFVARKAAWVKAHMLEGDKNITLKQAPDGPRSVPKAQFEKLNEAKYRRDLTQEEAEDYLSWLYHENYGCWPNLSNPHTYNEKLNWLKIHYHNPKLHVIADKARFHSFVLTKMSGHDEHCIKPLAILNRPGEMTNELLATFPERFVMKSNVGSGAQEFVWKPLAAIGHLREQIARWLNPRNNHYYMALEWSYKDIQPVVLCEPVIDFLYKIEFYCFGGEPFIYWIVKNDKTREVCANLYDIAGNQLPVSWHYPNFNENVPQPSYFDDLVNAAKILSKEFPHVRVDFYAAKDTWYFSEMTFYTWAGLMPFSDPAYDIVLGKKIMLEGICE